MINIMLDLAGNLTALYPIIHGHVLEVDQVISDKLMKWRMFSAQWKLDVTTFHGKRIYYSGVKYEGSPEHVFWSGFVEPFLRDGIESTLRLVVDECAIRKLKPTVYLDEASSLLELLVEKTYLTMAEIDKVLMGGGYPKSIEPRDVSTKIEGMTRYIGQFRTALTHRAEEGTGEILTLKPSFQGISLDLRALWRWIKSKVRHTSNPSRGTRHKRRAPHAQR